MTFKFLPDVALADIAFEAESKTLDGLFESSALAMADVMVDPSTLAVKTSRDLALKADDVERLLYDFLTELIVIKDVDSLLFKEVNVRVDANNNTLSASLKGEPIDRDRHTLRNDVKAVTMHMFGIKREGDSWKVTVVLDI